MDAAFRLFTERIDDWWPASRRHAGEPSVVVLAPDGFLERLAGGDEVPPGRVVRWDPPNGLLLEFFLATDPDHPAEVAVTFHPERGGTRVRVEHRPLPSSADLWDERAPRYATLRRAITRGERWARRGGRERVRNRGCFSRRAASRSSRRSRDPDLESPALVVRVGRTELSYHLSCIEDLHAMLSDRGDWVPLGTADEQKPAKEGTVEAWGRSPGNPVGGSYGLKRGLRGRFGNYVPPSSRSWGSPRCSTTPGTIGCGPDRARRRDALRAPRSGCRPPAAWWIWRRRTPSRRSAACVS